jgi:hypothetical protein
MKNLFFLFFLLNFYSTSSAQSKEQKNASLIEMNEIESSVGSSPQKNEQKSHWVIPPTANMTFFYYQSASTPICFDGKQCTVIFSDETKVTVPFDTVILKPGGFIVRKNKLFGFCRLDGQEVLPAIYEKIYPLSNWAFIVTNYGKEALVLENNKFLLKYNEYNNDFKIRSDSIIQVRNKFYSRDAQLIPNLKDDDFFRPGFVKKVNEMTSIYMLSFHGKTRLDTIWSIEDLKNGLFSGGTKSGYGIFNGKTNQWVIEPKMWRIFPPNILGYLVVADSTRQYGIMRNNGTWLLPVNAKMNIGTTYDPALFNFITEGKTGLMDSLGKIIIPAKLQTLQLNALCDAFGVENGDSVQVFLKNGQLLPFKGVKSFVPITKNTFELKIARTDAGSKPTETSAGLAKTDGTWILPPIFTGQTVIDSTFYAVSAKFLPNRHAPSFETISDEKRFLLYNLEGKPLSNEYFSYVEMVGNGCASFIQNGKLGIFNKNGIVLPAEFNRKANFGSNWLFLTKNEQTGLFRL